MFDNVFTAKILEMWDKKDFTLPPLPMQGCSPLLSQYHNGLFHAKIRQGGGCGGEGVEDIFF